MGGGGMAELSQINQINIFNCCKNTKIEGGGGEEEKESPHATLCLPLA